MGYQIQYVPAKVGALEARKNSKQRILLYKIIAIVVILAGSIIGGRPLRRWLSPGDPAVTDKAFADMITSLRSGDDFSEALSVFCMEVIKDDVQS